MQTFNDLYDAHRNGFVKWLNQRAKGKAITQRTAKDYLSAVDRFFTSETVTHPSHFSVMDGDKQTRGVRNFLNYLEGIDIDAPLGHSLRKWRDQIQIRASGFVEVYPSDEEIMEAFNACPPEHRTVLKALIYSGNRFSQLYGTLVNLQPEDVTYAGSVAHIPAAGQSAGTKRSYRLFFPAAFIPELLNVKLLSPDYTLKSIQHGRVSAKTIRKWHLNFMVEHDVSESLADFMQGRAPVTVGSAHYLNKVKQSVAAYEKVLPFLPQFPSSRAARGTPGQEEGAPKKGGTRRKPVDYAKVEEMLKAGKLHRQIIAETGINKTRLSEFLKKHPELRRK